jgi:hypothetical protein
MHVCLQVAGQYSLQLLLFTALSLNPLIFSQKAAAAGL